MATKRKKGIEDYLERAPSKKIKAEVPENDERGPSKKIKTDMPESEPEDNDMYKNIGYSKMRGGVYNLYNTCYVGVALQILASRKDLLQDIMLLPTEIVNPGGKNELLTMQTVLLSTLLDNKEKLDKAVMTALCMDLGINEISQGDAMEQLSTLVEKLKLKAARTNLEENFRSRFESEKEGRLVGSVLNMSPKSGSLEQGLKDCEKLGAPSEFILVEINRSYYNVEKKEPDRLCDRFQYPAVLESSSVKAVFPDGGDDLRYLLHAVVIHQYKEGLAHYTLAVRSEDSTWVLYDDIYVQKISEDKVLELVGDPKGNELQALASGLVYRREEESDREAASKKTKAQALLPDIEIPKKEMEVPKKKSKVVPSDSKATKGTRKSRCKVCEGCLAEDCRICDNCKDMKKYGGDGRLKQGCKQRRCLDPQQPGTAAAVSAPLQLPSSAKPTKEDGPVVQIKVPVHIWNNLEELKKGEKKTAPLLKLKMLEGDHVYNTNNWKLIDEERLHYHKFKVCRKVDLKKPISKVLGDQMHHVSPRLHMVQMKEAGLEIKSARIPVENTFTDLWPEGPEKGEEIRMIRMEEPDDERKKPLVWKIFEPASDIYSQDSQFLTQFAYLDATKTIREVMDDAGQIFRKSPVQCYLVIDGQLDPVLPEATFSSVFEKVGDVIPVLLLEEQDSLAKSSLKIFMEREVNMMDVQLISSTEPNRMIRICKIDDKERIMSQIRRELKFPYVRLFSAQLCGKQFYQVRDITETLSDMSSRRCLNVLKAERLETPEAEADQTFQKELKLLQQHKVCEKAKTVSLPVSSPDLTVQQFLASMNTEDQENGRLHLVKLDRGKIHEIVDQEELVSEHITMKPGLENGVALVRLPCDLTGYTLIPCYMYRGMFFNLVNSPGILVLPQGLTEDKLQKYMENNLDKVPVQLKMIQRQGGPKQFCLSDFLQNTQKSKERRTFEKFLIIETA